MQSLLWLIICVILILGLAYFFTKYVVGRGIPMSRYGVPGGMLNAVARMHLGRDQQIVLIRAGERYFLIGSTATQITTLAELSAEEVGAWCEKDRQMGEVEQHPSFAQSLREVLKQRNGRYNGD